MSDSSWVDMQTPFDIISVMQYGGYGFSNNGQPTITGLASDFYQIKWLKRSELIKYLKWGKKLICNFPFTYFFIYYLKIWNIEKSLLMVEIPGSQQLDSESALLQWICGNFADFMVVKNALVNQLAAIMTVIIRCSKNYLKRSNTAFFRIIWVDAQMTSKDTFSNQNVVMDGPSVKTKTMRIQWIYFAMLNKRRPLQDSHFKGRILRKILSSRKKNNFTRLNMTKESSNNDNNYPSWNVHSCRSRGIRVRQ